MMNNFTILNNFFKKKKVLIIRYTGFKRKHGYVKFFYYLKIKLWVFFIKKPKLFPGLGILA